MMMMVMTIYRARMYPCCKQRAHCAWATTIIKLVCTGYVCVAIIHRSLTRTTGSLSCAQMLMHAISHGGVYGHRKRVCTESWLWEENSLPHWGNKPASAAWRFDALTNWATSHPSTVTFCILCGHTGTSVSHSQHRFWKKMQMNGAER